MSISKFKTLLSIVLLCLTIETSAQEVIATAGENLQANGLQLNFTLGQLINQTSTNENIILTQGFHQSFAEIVETLAVSETPITISTYPNPAQTSLNIRTEEEKVIHYCLYDLNGAKVAVGKFFQSTNIDILEFAKGTYQLILTNDQEQLIEAVTVLFK